MYVYIYIYIYTHNICSCWLLSLCKLGKQQTHVIIYYIYIYMYMLKYIYIYKLIFQVFLANIDMLPIQLYIITRNIHTIICVGLLKFPYMSSPWQHGSSRTISKLIVDLDENQGRGGPSATAGATHPQKMEKREILW